MAQLVPGDLVRMGRDEMRSLATELIPTLRALPLDTGFDTRVTEVPRTRQSCEAFAAVLPGHIRERVAPGCANATSWLRTDVAADGAGKQEGRVATAERLYGPGWLVRRRAVFAQALGLPQFVLNDEDIFGVYYACQYGALQFTVESGKMAPYPCMLCGADPKVTPPTKPTRLLCLPFLTHCDFPVSPAHHFPPPRRFPPSIHPPIHPPITHDKVRKEFETIEDWVGISDRWGNANKKAAVKTLLRAIGDRLGNATLGAHPEVALWFTHDSTLQPLLSR